MAYFEARDGALLSRLEICILARGWVGEVPPRPEFQIHPRNGKSIPSIMPISGSRRADGDLPERSPILLGRAGNLAHFTLSRFVNLIAITTP